MRKNKTGKLIIFCSCIFFLVTLAFAETIETTLFSPVKHPARAKVDRKCIESFDIDKIDFKDQKYARFTSLGDYSGCMAILKQTKKECLNCLAKPQAAEWCVRNFQKCQGCLNSILESGDVQTQLSHCQEFLGRQLDDKGTVMFFRAWLRNDISLCDNINKSGFQKDLKKVEALTTLCRAITSADKTLCESKGCEENVLLTKALKSRNPKICRQIRSSHLKIICEVSITKDRSVCEASDDYLKFRDEYCTVEETE